MPLPSKLRPDCKTIHKYAVRSILTHEDSQPGLQTLLSFQGGMRGRIRNGREWQEVRKVKIR